jgi:hypothetical protein
VSVFRMSHSNLIRIEACRVRYRTAAVSREDTNGACSAPVGEIGLIMPKRCMGNWDVFVVVGLASPIPIQAVCSSLRRNMLTAQARGSSTAVVTPVWRPGLTEGTTSRLWNGGRCQRMFFRGELSPPSEWYLAVTNMVLWVPNWRQSVLMGHS